MLKKSTIVALAGSLIVGGIGLSVVGVALGGKTQVSYGGIHQFFEKTDASIESISYVEDSRSKGLVKGESGVISESLGHFDKLDIEIGTVNFNIVEGEQYKIEVDIKRNVDLSYGIKNNTLHIKQKFEPQFNMGDLSTRLDGSITITIPRDMKLEEVEIESGVGQGLIENIKTKKLDMESGVGIVKIKEVIADEVIILCGVGDLNIEGLTAEKTKVEGGVGSIKAYDLISNKLEASIGVGSVLLEGDIKGNIAIEGGIGGLELNLAGRESDYNYLIERGGGKITINDTKQAGVGDVKIQNDGRYDIEISAGLGEIKITTKE